MADQNSEILVIGGTGNIGKYIVEASAKLGHPTFALIRENTVTNNPEKSKLVESFKSYGVKLFYGDIFDHESLVRAIKQVEVVISAVGSTLIADQVKIISAIKEAGNVKRFLPSEFAMDPDRVHTVEPATSLFKQKAMIRRAIEAEGIPYTFVSSNVFAGCMLHGLGRVSLSARAPPRDTVILLGDGNAKVIVVREEDVGTYTIKAVDDPRTLNKTLYLRPPANVMSVNEIVALWERIIGKTFEKSYVPEDQLLKKIQDFPAPLNFSMALGYSIMVKGDCANFEIGDSFGVEASQLYPEVKYTAIDKCLAQFA